MKKILLTVTILVLSACGSANNEPTAPAPVAPVAATTPAATATGKWSAQEMQYATDSCTTSGTSTVNTAPVARAYCTCVYNVVAQALTYQEFASDPQGVYYELQQANIIKDCATKSAFKY